MAAKSDNPIIHRHDQPTVLINVTRVPELMQPLVDQAKAYGWHLVDYTISRFMPGNPPPIGAIVQCYPSDPLCQQLRDLKIPVVALGHEFPTSVHLDIFAQGEMAADHFIKRGFTDVAYVGHSQVDTPRLYEGLKARAAEHGVTAHLYRLEHEMSSSREGIEDKSRRRDEAIGNWLKGLPKPVGFLGYHLKMATRVCIACYNAGLKVPEEVAILGVGTDEITSEVSPVPLSSLDTNLHLQALEAARLLKRLIAHESCPAEPVMIPPKEVIERQSTDVLAVKDPRVAKALRYLWDHLDQPITVEDVARETDIARSTLDRLCRKHLGRALNAELQRKRLEACCKLLRTTDYPISKIVPLVGFRSKGYLHRLFKTEFGQSPAEYRTKYGKK